jgi:hypothetical protein
MNCSKKLKVLKNGKIFCKILYLNKYFLQNKEEHFNKKLNHRKSSNHYHRSLSLRLKNSYNKIIRRVGHINLRDNKIKIMINNNNYNYHNKKNKKNKNKIN